MMGVREAVLRPLNMAQGADAQVHDGRLCIRLHPRQPWVAAMRIPTALAARACCWVTISVHAATEGTASVMVLCNACHRGVSRSVSAVRPRQRHDVQQPGVDAYAPVPS